MTLNRFFFFLRDGMLKIAAHIAHKILNFRHKNSKTIKKIKMWLNQTFLIDVLDWDFFTLRLDSFQGINTLFILQLII